MTERTFRTEFPDFAPADMPAIPAGFEDQSWHNDTCPSFRDEAAALTLYVDFADASLREYPEADRFCLKIVHPDDTHASEVYLYEGNDWDALLAIHAAYVAELASSPYAAPLTTLDEGKAFIQLLEDTERSFHFEDSPESIICIGGGDRDGDQFFTHAECVLLRLRVAELYAMDWAPAGHECPIGYALEVSGHVMEVE